VATVFFAIGSRPGLAAHEAEAIAELLAAEDDPAARSAAAKIQERAADSPEAASRDVELEPDELRQLALVLEAMRSQTDFRVSLGRLHEDVAAALR
jgi:hypothetical protein